MSEESRRNFLRTAGFAFAGASGPLPLELDASAHRNRLHADVPAEEAWRRFTAALADALADLEEDQFLIVVKKGTNFFTQFFCEGRHGLRVEAVSDVYLRPLGQSHLPRQREQLIAIGWNRPTLTPEEDRAGALDGSPNYFLDVPWPVPHHDVAALATRTLREVFGVRHPGFLEYYASDIDGTQVRFPSLRLRRSSR